MDSWLPGVVLIFLLAAGSLEDRKQKATIESEPLNHKMCRLPIICKSKALRSYIKLTNLHTSVPDIFQHLPSFFFTLSHCVWVKSFMDDYLNSWKSQTIIKLMTTESHSVLITEFWFCRIFFPYGHTVYSKKPFVSSTLVTFCFETICSGTPLISYYSFLCFGFKGQQYQLCLLLVSRTDVCVRVH